MPHIDNDIKLDFKDVLLRPKRSTLKSRGDVDLERSYKFCNSGQQYKGVPIIAANMDTVGTFEMAKALAKHGLFTTIHKHYSVEAWKEFITQNLDIVENVAISSGSGPGDFDKLKAITEAIPQINYICLDVANGYSEHFVSFVRQVRKAFPSFTIMDGGCSCPGDVAKAFGAGADFVMIGGMFAGHDQSGGDITEKNGRKVKSFYGMSSATAMKMYHGGVAEYRASEGKSVEVPYKGDVEQTVLDILGGLRSACTYTGASKLKELPRRTTFIRVTQQWNQTFQNEVSQ
ncbi:GMP reductase 2-like isoform X4 [Limulus polyphemus]|uniref:GMP reductase n=1 Tax=Limulus polyphemus TaxID=6850 RepID=A0ABM1RXG1_LIMPO|nr:GMP reductase 2-like isoform X4 [Limulus polyphemus]